MEGKFLRRRSKNRNDMTRELYFLNLFHCIIQFFFLVRKVKIWKNYTFPGGLYNHRATVPSRLPEPGVCERLLRTRT